MLPPSIITVDIISCVLIELICSCIIKAVESIEAAIISKIISSIIRLAMYDQQYGDRATHIEPVTRGQNTGECVYLGTACCQSSHKYKIVAKRDISQYSGAYTFVYEWTM